MLPDYSDFATSTESLPYVTNDHRGPLARACESLRGTVVGTSTQTLYVDPTLGNDANPGTQALPLATLPAALNKVPVSWKRKIRIYLAAGTYSLGTQFSWYAGSPVGVTVSGDGGTPGTSPGNAPDSLGGAGRNVTIIGTYQQIDSGTLTGVTLSSGFATRLTDAGKAWAVNSQEGMICRLTSGAAAGVAFHIRESAATTLDPLYPPGTSPVPAIGDTYVIEKPASIVQFGTAATFYGAMSGLDVGLSIYGVAFEPTVANAQLNFVGISALLSGVTIGTSAFATAFTLAGNELTFGGNIRTDLDLLGNLQRRLGVYANRCSVNFTGVRATRGIVLIQRGAGAFNVQNHSYAPVTAYDSKGGAAMIVSDSYVPLTPVSATGFAGIRINGASTSGLQSVVNGYVKLLSGSMDLSSNTGAGGLADTNGTIDATSFGIVGTGNTTYGISCQHFGRMIANAAVTVTGTSGECVAGATAGTWAGIVGGTALTEAKSQTALIPFV